MLFFNEVGAVDYITKPFVIGALQRKIKAMFAMLEHHKPAKDIYDDGRLFLDFSEQAASLNGKPLTLSQMEYKMLNLFRKNPRQVLTRGQLLEKLWDIDEKFVDEHTLTTSISRIRSKIESDGGALLLCALVGIFVLTQVFGKRLSQFTADLCQTLDHMIAGNEAPQRPEDSETQLARIGHRLARLYQIMQENRRLVDEELQELQTLVSDISHQVKTPVSNLKMAADTLLETGVIQLDKKPGHLFDTVVQAMSGIVYAAEKLAGQCGEVYPGGRENYGVGGAVGNVCRDQSSRHWQGHFRKQSGRYLPALLSLGTN